MLKDLVKNKKVALVGPSPHILGKKQGSFIDSFDIVIRVNEFGIPSSLYEDYGSKTNIIFVALHENSNSIFKEMIKKMIYQHLNLFCVFPMNIICSLIQKEKEV